MHCDGLVVSGETKERVQLIPKHDKTFTCSAFSILSVHVTDRRLFIAVVIVVSIQPVHVHLNSVEFLKFVRWLEVVFISLEMEPTDLVGQSVKFFF